jgi:hypothetical protein
LVTFASRPNLATGRDNHSMVVFSSRYKEESAREWPSMSKA